MFLLLSYLSFLAFDVVSRSRGKSPFSFSFSFFFSFSFLSPNFPCFFFFCDEENKRRERLCKKRVFSRFEFLRTIYEVYGYIRPVSSSSLARAVPSQRARVEGTGRGGRVKLSCKVGFLFRVSNSQRKTAIVNNSSIFNGQKQFSSIYIT